MFELECFNYLMSKKMRKLICNTCKTRAVTRTLIGGRGRGVNIHILLFCPTSFFSNQIQTSQFEKKSVGHNMNI